MKKRRRGACHDNERFMEQANAQRTDRDLTNGSLVHYIACRDLFNCAPRLTHLLEFQCHEPPMCTDSTHSTVHFPRNRGLLVHLTRFDFHDSNIASGEPDRAPRQAGVPSIRWHAVYGCL